MNRNYDDIIHLPHHVSATRPRMPISNRAAQFAPFQALSGYEAIVAETARLTDKRIELDGNALEVLDRKLNILTEMTATHPEIVVTFFQADERKAGGTYITVAGALKKIDEYARVVALTDGRNISIDDILDIECELFKGLI